MTLVDIKLRLLLETDKAWKVTEGHRHDAVWLPKSQVEYDEASGEFTMPQWLAAEKGFAGY